MVRVYLPQPLAEQSDAITEETGISSAEQLREGYTFYLLVRQGLKRIGKTALENKAS